MVRDLIARVMPRPVYRRHPNHHLTTFKRNLALADGPDAHPLVAFLSLDDDAAAMGLGPDWAGQVRDMEAECDALIGARPCPDGIPHGWESPRFPGEMQAFRAPCPSCGAAL